MAKQNWATNINFHDAITLHPKSEEELSKAVLTSTKIRARGSAHCFNTIADTRNTSVILDAMPIKLEIHPERRTATVSAGLNYATISEFLESKGWALSNLASLPHISVAGALATGSHGTGIRNGALHTSVKSVELMGPDGTIRTLTRGVDNDFNSSIVALGLSGIAISFELDIEPSFQIMQTVYAELPTDTFRENLVEILSSAYSVSYFTIWEKSKFGDLWMKSKVLPPANYFGAAARNEKVHPSVGEDADSCTEQLGVPGPWHLRLPHFRIDANPSIGNELQSEFFVASENASAAFGAIQEISHNFGEKLLASEIRAIAADDHWMSPAYVRQSISIHFTWKNDYEVLYLISLIETALEPFEYRPHLGKVFNPESIDFRKALPRFDQFREAMLQLDPTEKFQNEFTAELFEQ